VKENEKSCDIFWLYRSIYFLLWWKILPFKDAMEANKGTQKQQNKQWCVTVCVALPFTLKKKYLKAKEEELQKLTTFPHAKI
jgi:hypothetical protein